MKKIKKKYIKKEALKDQKIEWWSKKIVKYIILSAVIIFILLLAFIYSFIVNALGPVDEANDTPIEVTIPVGSNANDIAQLLNDADIVSHPEIFAQYLKFNNNEELQAGHYQFSQAMGAQEITETLIEGGEPIQVDADTTITVIEGMHIEEIAQMVEEQTAISAEDFLSTINDAAFIEQMMSRFPSMLSEVDQIEGLRYTLEGYLYPATYDYFAGMTAQELITEMVAAMNNVYQRLIPDLENTYLTFHQVLTLASIVEREAVTEEDRRLVAGVFYNRLDAGMPLQSDITILYALREHKEFVTYSDLEVDSPYNTYESSGLPPGPINSPSLMSIEASIYPEWNSYYYFVADLDTGDVYYSSTIEEHNLLVEEYVNARQSSIEEEAESQMDETQENEQPTE